MQFKSYTIHRHIKKLIRKKYYPIQRKNQKHYPDAQYVHPR